MLYQTQARIHLGNIRDNLHAIRQAIGPRKLLLAVKANAYGHGAVAVGRLAQACGVDWLGVATVPDGIQLRTAGISLPVLKLSPTFPQEMEAAVSASLTLALSDGAGARALETVCAAKDLRSRVHLELETGMGRTGVPITEAPALARLIELECPHLHLEGLFTHLPASDEADGTFTRAQTRAFQQAVETVETALGRRPELVHCANSGGVLGHPDSWMDLVARPPAPCRCFRACPSSPGWPSSNGWSRAPPSAMVAPGPPGKRPGSPPYAAGTPTDSIASSPTRATFSSAAGPIPWWAGCAWTRPWWIWGPPRT